jgi:aspartyl-tRNA(Asn)/glutamyl-tRNA(Gln) amidotransferase subunit B
MPATSRPPARVELKVGLEIHVELATRTKMFSRCPNGASPEFDRGGGAAPNTLIDPVVLGLPGALPVMNKAAVEMSMMVGLALGCSIAHLARWDRKSYFYPDLPKGYQISQYQLPLCFDGAIDLPRLDADGQIDWSEGEGGVPPKRIGIIRAHLEEDAGKLLHEAPGGVPIGFSIVDLNRAGTPLLEIVTQPDFSSAAEVVLFAQLLRGICRFLGVTEGIMQKGHMRFEPNINTILTLDDGRTIRTPIVEIKNLNSFKSLAGAIEFELAEQPRRWLQDGIEFAPGTKTTRGWDDAASGGGRSFVQREKEEAHDYRYFPDPDLLPVAVDEAWREAVRARIPELPLARMKRYIDEFAMTRKEAAALVEEREVCLFYERAIEEAVGLGVPRPRAGKLAANFILQSGLKRANELAGAKTDAGAAPPLVSELGISARQIAGLIKLREDGTISSNAADELFGLLCLPEHAGAGPAALASSRGMLTIRDESVLDAWCDAAIAQNAKVADDVRAGKLVAVGRLVGAVMKLSGGAADAKAARSKVLEKLGVKDA